MITKLNKDIHIVLASKSPRRQELIKGLELNFTIKTYEVDESFSSELKGPDIAVYLAEKKANAYPEQLKPNEILLTADTIVWLNNAVLNKPEDEADAFRMLKSICGNKHEVFTGVCLKSMDKTISFSDRTEVFCKELSDEGIWHYIRNYKPLDKAGSYGIQDWFGYTTVERINGCFYNVMGLPVGKIYEKLLKF